MSFPPDAAPRSIGIYVALAVLPPLVFSVLPVTSQAPGIALAVIAATLLLMLGPRRAWRRYQLLMPVVVLLALLTHFTLVAQWRPVDLGRFAGSLILLGGVLLVAARCAQPLFGGLTARALRGVFAAFVVCGGLAAAGLRVATVNATSKPVFPFSEASHFGLALCPLVLCLAVVSRRPLHQLLYIGIALVLALTLQNFTLLVGLMLIATVCLPFRWILPVLVVAALAVGFAFSAGLEGLLYYTERLNFSADSENITALVVIQGWQMISEAWAATNAWGLGLQQLGIDGPTAEVSELIYTLNGGDYLNLQDGGFLLAKLAGELGVFGVGLVAAYVVIALRCALTLRGLAQNQLPDQPVGVVFAHSIVVMYLLEVFVRSPGYLTGAAALVLAALSFLLSSRERTGVTVRPSSGSAVGTSC